MRGEETSTSGRRRTLRPDEGEEIRWRVSEAYFGSKLLIDKSTNLAGGR